LVFPCHGGHGVRVSCDVFAGGAGVGVGGVSLCGGDVTGAGVGGDGGMGGAGVSACGGGVGAVSCALGCGSCMCASGCVCRGVARAPGCAWSGALVVSGRAVSCRRARRGVVSGCAMSCVSGRVVSCVRMCAGGVWARGMCMTLRCARGGVGGAPYVLGCGACVSVGVRVSGCVCRGVACMSGCAWSGVRDAAVSLRQAARHMWHAGAWGLSEHSLRHSFSERSGAALGCAGRVCVLG
jgi:hypothetical protein